MDRKFLDTREAAEFLGLGPQTLNNWRHLKQGPPYLRVGVKRIVYDPADLERYAKQRRIDPQEK